MRDSCIRRIGSHSTKIWFHPQLPDLVNPFIATERSSHYEEATVASLVNP